MKARELQLLLILCALGAPATSAARPAKTEASRLFAEASRLFAAGDFANAAASFRRAHALRPHFSVRCNVALCFERLEDFVSAAAEYQACLDEGAAKTPRAPQVETSLAAMAARVGHVDVTSPPPGGEVLVDGRSVGQAPQRVALNPGKHVFELRRDGAHAARSEVQLKGGEALQLSLAPRLIESRPPPQLLPPDDPPPPQRRRRRRRTGLSSAWFWTGVGATVGLSAAAIVLGAQTLSARDAFEADPTQDNYDRGIARRTATNVLWGAAAACGAATTVIFFYTDFGGRTRRRSSARDAAFGIGVGGAF